MGVDKITSKILEDANKEKEEILAKAREEAEKILEQARKEAEEKKSSILKRGEKEAEMTYNRILAEARLQAKRKLLEEREKLIQMALDKLREDLEKVPERDDYKDILLKLIVEGVFAIGGGELYIHLNERDYGLLTDETLWAIENEAEERLKKATIIRRGEPVDIIGGCIVKTVDGAKMYDNSLEAVFERNIDSIRTKVAEIIF